MIAAIRASQNF